MTEPRRIYVAGPMTGYLDYNYPAFNAAAVALRSLGHHVENPAENEHLNDGTWGWSDYLRRALTQLLTCDAIVLLPGWEQSKGAQIESDLAETLGIEPLLISEFFQGPRAKTADEKGNDK